MLLVLLAARKPQKRVICQICDLVSFLSAEVRGSYHLSRVVDLIIKSKNSSQFKSKLKDCFLIYSTTKSGGFRHA